MSTNRYFNFRNYTPEQNLAEDLIIECIQIYGEDIAYLPRKKQNTDLLFGEDVLSKFDDHFEIEMYIQSAEGFEGDGNIFRKFGIDIKDQVTLVVSRNRFIESVEGDMDPPRPKEGDLIYFPLNDALFEIKFVKDESIFYPLGALQVFEIQAEQFVYSNEEFNTGYGDIDQVEQKYDHTINLYFESGEDSLDLEIEDVLYQGVSYPDDYTAAAKVVKVIDDETVEVRDISCQFVADQEVFVENSMSSLILLRVNDQEIVNDASALNKEIEEFGDSFIDFSESNPFSEDDY